MHQNLKKRENMFMLCSFYMFTPVASAPPGFRPQLGRLQVRRCGGADWGVEVTSSNYLLLQYIVLISPLKITSELSNKEDKR